MHKTIFHCEWNVFPSKGVTTHQRNSTHVYVSAEHRANRPHGDWAEDLDGQEVVILYSITSKNSKESVSVQVPLTWRKRKKAKQK